MIKSLNYLLDNKAQSGVPDHIYTNYLDEFGIFIGDTNNIQKAIVRVAMLQYHHKYGKYPVRLKQLVPEFLAENELYLAVYDKNSPSPLYYTKNRYQHWQLLYSNSMAYMKKYIKENKRYIRKHSKNLLRNNNIGQY